MLKWTAERKIVVQIEVWDRFDYSRDNWETSPWNPKNNVTYTYQQTSFARKYPAHPSRDLQPFFHSIEGMPRYDVDQCLHGHTHSDIGDRRLPP